MKQRFILIRPNENSIPVETNVNDEDEFFEIIEDLIETKTIEEVHIYKNLFLLVDEEGKIKKNPKYNFMLYKEKYLYQSDIVNDCVLVKIENGKIQPLDVDFMMWFIKLFNDYYAISQESIAEYFARKEGEEK